MEELMNHTMPKYYEVVVLCTKNLEKNMNIGVTVTPERV